MTRVEFLSVVVVAAAGGLALAGCGAVVTFKPGAGPDRMAVDERSCGQAGSKGFVECMRSHGWYVRDTSAASEAVPSADPHGQVPGSPPVTAVPAGGRAGNPVPAVAPTPAAAAAMRSAEPAAPPGAVALERLRVGSWWKLGGTAAGLEGAIDTCVADLGADHRPDPGAIVVTVGLRECLRADGWYAMDVSSVTPAAPGQ